MIITVMVLVFAAALVLGLPIAVAIVGSSLVPQLMDSGFPANAAYIIRSMIAGVDSFTILALPLFMLSGDIMCKGGISKNYLTCLRWFPENVRRECRSPPS